MRVRPALGSIGACASALGDAEILSPSLRALLVSYDEELERTLHEVLDTTTGLERVQMIHGPLRRSIAVHDAVLAAALCPLLGDLPGGPPIAERLKKGCEERAELLRRFGKLSHNVYPISGEEVEQILGELEQSLRRHVHDETDEVERVLKAAGASADLDVISARMALETERAPTRVHRGTLRHPDSAGRKLLYRTLDRFGEWSDTHTGWANPQPLEPSRRATQVEMLKRHAAGAPSVRELLAGYDQEVDAAIASLRGASTQRTQREAVAQLMPAITIHDSVIAGVLCPLLDGVAGGAPLAEQMRAGCRRRSELLLAWSSLLDRAREHGQLAADSPEVQEILEPLIESFQHHEREETLDSTALLAELPGDAFRGRSSALADAMWSWHSEGPSAPSAPTRPVPRPAIRHPSVDPQASTGPELADSRAPIPSWSASRVA